MSDILIVDRRNKPKKQNQNVESNNQTGELTSMTIFCFGEAEQYTRNQLWRQQYWTTEASVSVTGGGQ